MKIKDSRYEIVRVFIETKRMDRFDMIFHYLPKSVLAKDLGITVKAFSERIHNPGLFHLDNFFEMAELIGCRSADLYTIIEAQVQQDKKKPKWKPKR